MVVNDSATLQHRFITLSFRPVKLQNNVRILGKYAIRVILIETRKEWYLECAVLELYTKVSRVLIDDILLNKNLKLK